MQSADLLLPILVSAFVAAGASLLGSFAILKRMALVGDALGHVALPGLALALIYNINPFIGAVAFLLVTVIGIWLVQMRSTLSLDTIVGVFFTASLALGALITPEHELLEALFGNVLDLGWRESAASITISLGVIVVILALHKKFTLNMVSGELAHSAGINTARLDLVYLLIFAVTVALGIRFVGALMMGSLVIIPAAAAKNVARSLRAFLMLSVVIGVASAFSGIIVSYRSGLSPGPVFILICAAIFALTLVIREVSTARA